MPKKKKSSSSQSEESQESGEVDSGHSESHTDTGSNEESTEKLLLSVVYNGSIIKIEVEPEDTLGDVRSKLAAEINIDAAKVELCHRRKPVRKSVRIEDLVQHSLFQGWIEGQVKNDVSGITDVGAAEWRAAIEVESSPDNRARQGAL